MIKKFISKINDTFKNLDKTALHILKYGLRFCFILCLISIVILFIYQLLKKSPIIFEIGFTLFRVSLIFAIEFIICAIAADKIKKQII